MVTETENDESEEIVQVDEIESIEEWFYRELEALQCLTFGLIIFQI
jgi:hypothetical protein